MAIGGRAAAAVPHGTLPQPGCPRRERHRATARRVPAAERQPRARVRRGHPRHQVMTPAGASATRPRGAPTIAALWKPAAVAAVCSLVLPPAMLARGQTPVAATGQTTKTA